MDQISFLRAELQRARDIIEKLTVERDEARLETYHLRRMSNCDASIRKSNNQHGDS